MKRLLLVGLVVVSACGPKAGPTATQAASPAAPTSSAVATASAGNSPGSLSCRLPVADFEYSADHSTWTLKAGVVTFPGAGLTIDPNAAFEAMTANGFVKVKSVVKPYLYGGPGVATFTRRYGRWLPASLSAVSPDSSHYAYSEPYNDANGPRSRIHVVDVASAADRVAYDQGFYGVIGYESEGIYLFAVGYGDAPNSGLWRLDPQARSLTKIGSDNLTVDYIGGGGAWYSDLAPGDQPPSTLTNPMARAFFKDRVLRLDLKTGVAASWFRQRGIDVRAIGVDGLGHVIVTGSPPTDAATSTSEELWLITTPGAARQLYSGPGSDSPDFVRFSTPLADAHGVWFGSKKGVYLYTPEGTLQKVSSAVGEVAGRCS